MTAVDESVAVASPLPLAVAAPRRRRRRWLVVAGLLSYLALAAIVLGPLWADPNGRVFDNNHDDHGFFLFVLAHGHDVVFEGAHPFLSTRLNVPDGVNMMANTSILALSLPVAPVTHWFGPGVSMALLLTLSLFGTAAAWYVVLRRHVVRSAGAAYLGGLWCGFAPAMVSHANAHINFVAQFLVPFMVARVLALREPGRSVRNGVVLGLLVTLQAFLNEEVLLFTAMACAVFVAAYAVLDLPAARAAVRPFLAGLGVTAVVAGVLLAYPLWFQFFGPQHYRGQPFSPRSFVTDLLSFGAYARESLAGRASVSQKLSVSATEENSFFGVPLLIMIGVAVAMLRRSAAGRAIAITGGTFVLIGLGPQLRVANHDTGFPLPFALIKSVPIIDLVSVTRFTMVAATVVGIVLALAVDRMATPAATYSRRARRWFRIGLVVALVPVAPTPLPVHDAPPLPAFLAGGRWREYVPAGRTLVPVPPPEVTTGREAMRWLALSPPDLVMPRGYFMGPVDPPSDRKGSWTAPLRPTSDLLAEVARGSTLVVAEEHHRATMADLSHSKTTVVVTDAHRRAAAADLAHWRAAVLVLVGDHAQAPALRDTVTALLGRPPRQVDDVLLWDVRDAPVPSMD